MASGLQSSNIVAPGFYGLNTQESGVTIDKGFAEFADNCIIDKFGRLGARKGWYYLAEQADVGLKGMHRFISIEGTEYLGLWSDDTFYLYGAGALNEVTYSGAQTIQDGGWQAVTLNDAAYLFQRGYEPLYFDTISQEVKDISDAPSHQGIAPQGNTVLSAYGRLWAADTVQNKTTFYWSDLLEGTRWDSGSSGSLDISSILVNGNDEIVALGAHNGFLVVFCKNNILIFNDADPNKQFLDPTANFQLVEVIAGVGCVARDSVQNTGTDILFLSKSGVRSLGRVIQEKSQPMRELSKNIRDDLVNLLEGEDLSLIKSVYSEANAFYLLAFPTSRTVYCFDMRTQLQDGSARITSWNNMTFTSWLAYNNEVYMTNEDGLARYYGYQDNGQSYTMRYTTTHMDFGNSAQLKVLKKLHLVVLGTSGQAVTMKTNFDYSGNFRSYTDTLEQRTVAEYGTAEYGIAEYSNSNFSETLSVAAGGTGTVLQFEFDVVVDGGLLSIQQVDIHVKQGRIH